MVLSDSPQAVLYAACSVSACAILSNLLLLYKLARVGKSSLRSCSSSSQLESLIFMIFVVTLLSAICSCTFSTLYVVGSEAATALQQNSSSNLLCSAFQWLTLTLRTLQFWLSVSALLQCVISIYRSSRGGGGGDKTGKSFIAQHCVLSTTAAAFFALTFVSSPSSTTTVATTANSQQCGLLLLESSAGGEFLSRSALTFLITYGVLLCTGILALVISLCNCSKIATRSTTVPTPSWYITRQESKAGNSADRRHRHQQQLVSCACLVFVVLVVFDYAPYIAAVICSKLLSHIRLGEIYFVLVPTASTALSALLASLSCFVMHPKFRRGRHHHQKQHYNFDWAVAGGGGVGACDENISSASSSAAGDGTMSPTTTTTTHSAVTTAVLATPVKTTADETLRARNAHEDEEQEQQHQMYARLQAAARMQQPQLNLQSVSESVHDLTRTHGSVEQPVVQRRPRPAALPAGGFNNGNNHYRKSDAMLLQQSYPSFDTSPIFNMDERRVQLISNLIQAQELPPPSYMTKYHSNNHINNNHHHHNGAGSNNAWKRFSISSFNSLEGLLRAASSGGQQSSSLCHRDTIYSPPTNLYGGGPHAGAPPYNINKRHSTCFGALPEEEPNVFTLMGAVAAEDDATLQQMTTVGQSAAAKNRKHLLMTKKNLNRISAGGGGAMVGAGSEDPTKSWKYIPSTSTAAHNNSQKNYVNSSQLNLHGLFAENSASAAVAGVGFKIKPQAARRFSYHLPNEAAASQHCDERRNLDSNIISEPLRQQQITSAQQRAQLQQFLYNGQLENAAKAQQNSTASNNNNGKIRTNGTFNWLAATASPYGAHAVAGPPTRRASLQLPGVALPSRRAASFAFARAAAAGGGAGAVGMPYMTKRLQQNNNEEDVFEFVGDLERSPSSTHI